MNILLIGNGFDLTHGLPTKYTDFLEFVKVIKQIVKMCNGKDLSDIVWGNVNTQVKELIKIDLGNKRNNLYSQSNLWNDLVGDNIWIEYFLNHKMYQKENWIDFESEIGKVIQSLDNDMHGLGVNYNIEDDIISLSNDFLNKTYSQFTFTVQQINMLDRKEVSKSITYKEIRNKLLDDLNKLIRALEIYLCEYVEKIEIEMKSPDIDALNIDFILSFNYTHIFSKLYDVSSTSKQEIADPFDYIHGEADLNNTIETNNMVLGIDEFLPNDRKNKDIDFVAFKKFFQRIYKETGCKYKEWVDIIKKNERELKEKYKKEYPYQVPFKQYGDKRHRLYIFGHSLDVTDKDILKDLILNDNVHTTIFYHDKDAMGQQIANLVKVIEQDELIKRTGGSTKTIEFKQQHGMISIDN